MSKNDKKNSYPKKFQNLEEVASHLKGEKNKKYVLLFGYNGVGKTRLSMAFKDIAKKKKKNPEADTLYYNAYTEDLFTWDNDLDRDTDRVLVLNKKSNFFPKDKISDNIIEKIRSILHRYTDFDFSIDFAYKKKGEDKLTWAVNFIRNKKKILKYQKVRKVCLFGVSF